MVPWSPVGCPPVPPEPDDATTDQRPRTSQEEFWAGDFGDAYSSRNAGAGWVASNTALFADVLRGTEVTSALEIGANVGLNVQALQNLLPDAQISGLEINESAARQLEQTGCTVHRGSALDFAAPHTYDLVFTKGVLIHIHPDELEKVYRLLHEASHRYVFVAEYYSPRVESISYRGESDKLWRNDFAGTLMERYPDLQLLRTGFAYHRGQFPQDDLTWFLLEKRS